MKGITQVWADKGSAVNDNAKTDDLQLFNGRNHMGGCNTGQLIVGKVPERNKITTCFICSSFYLTPATMMYSRCKERKQNPCFVQNYDQL